MNTSVVEWTGLKSGVVEEERSAMEGFVSEEAAGVDAEVDAERWDGLS